MTNNCTMSRDVESVNQSLNGFVKIIREVTDPLFLKRYSTDGRPRYGNTRQRTAAWFDNECLLLKQEYLRALSEFNKVKTNENRVKWCDCKRRYKRAVNRKRRAFENNKRCEIIKLRHSKPKDFWKLFKTRKTTASNEITVEEFCEHFRNISAEVNSINNPEADNFCAEYNFDTNGRSYDELDRPISIDDVKNAIHSLSRNKATSDDFLLNEYFLETWDIIGGHIADIFNMVYSTGHFPEMWTRGIIIPLHKKGSVGDANNYRGITLVSCMAKLFTTILNKRLNDWCESHDVITDAQFGFRKGRSTVDAIFVLHSLIEKTINAKNRLYCAFVDLKKAFDSVNRNALWFKMYKCGIGGKMLRIVRSMYLTVKSCIRHCGSFSDFFEYSIGLRQGEVMSPLMFSVFLEDLELYLQDRVGSGLEIYDLTLILLLFCG